MVEKNKVIRLAAAKKTIERLENKLPCCKQMRSIGNIVTTDFNPLIKKQASNENSMFGTYKKLI